MSTQRNEKPVMQQVYEVVRSDQFKGEITRLLPPGVSVERFIQTAVVAINHNPELLTAERQSLYNAISKCASDGLLPDGKQCALVIFNKKDRNGNYYKVVQAMPMVEGIIMLMAKAGISAYAVSVYENDKIRIWNDDLGQHVTHEPVLLGDRGAFAGVMACARTKDQAYVEFLPVPELEKIRNASRMANSGPWVEWYERMCQKSGLHRLEKRVPKFVQSVIDSLSDPEDDPEVVPPAEIIEAPVQSEPEAPAPKRRPRALQALVSKTDVATADLTPDPVPSEPPQSAAEEVF